MTNWLFKTLKSLNRKSQLLSQLLSLCCCLSVAAAAGGGGGGGDGVSTLKSSGSDLIG